MADERAQPATPDTIGRTSDFGARPVIHLTMAARTERLRLGLLSWCVLEDLLAESTVDATGLLVARTSVRRLAEHLGVGKDSSAAALRRLGNVGLVTHQLSDRSVAGTFGTASYEIRSSSIIGLSVEHSLRPPARQRRRPAADQPALFDDQGQP